MMKKHSNSRPLKLALTLCLIMAISLAGVVLDSTGVSAAVTGSGTSSDPYIFTSEYPFSLGDLYSEVQDKFTLSNSKKYRLVYGTYEGFNSSEDDRPEWRYGTNYTFDYQKYTSIIITGWWSVQSTHTFQVNEYFNATVNFPDSYADRSIYYNSPNGIISCSHRNSFNLYNSNSIISVPRVEGKGIDITVSNKSIVSSITKNGEFYDIVLDLSSFSEYNVTLDIEYVDFPVISVSADPLEGTIGSVKAVNMDVDDLEGSSVWAEPGHTVQLVAEPAENCSLFGWKLPDGTVEIVPKGQPLTKNIIAGSNDQNYKAIFHTNSDPYVYRNGSKYYHQSELRQAIIDAQSGTNKTIVLVANARLDYSIEIPDGVTLLLPYAKGAEDVKSSSDTFPHANYFAEGQTSKLSTATDTKDRYLQLIVDVPSGSKDTTITIANGGRLVLGGKISADQGEYSGHTFATYTYKGTTYTGGHSDIVLDNPNSKILVDNGGVLSSIGYITGTGTVEANKNGTIYKPLIINDFGGGSYTTACWLSLSEKISPFDRYSMINIQTDIVLNPGSKLIGYCDLVAESEHYQTKAPLIGPSDSIIETGADSDTVITIDYDAETGEGAKTNFSTGNIVQDTLVTIDGSVTFGYLELTLVGTNIETNSVVFPLPYNYKLHFTRGTVEVPHRYKIMPGAEIEVDPGVTMNLGNGSDTAGLYVYDGFHSLKTNGVNYPLPEELYNAGYSQRARVIMNGTLNVNKNAVYAGILESTVSGAKLNIASNAGSHSNKTLTEGNAANKGGLGWSSTSTITLNGQLYVAGDEDLIPLVNGKSYTSIVPDDNSPVKTDLLAFNQTNSDDSVTNTLYSAESIYGKWTTSSTLTIDANGGSFPEGTVTSITMGSGLKILEVLPALNTATRTGYTQIGWNYVKNDQTIAVSEKSLMPGSTDITVKAVWDPNTYNVQFITNTMEGVDFPSVSSVTGIYGETLGEKAPSDPQKLGYTFEGWYKTAEFKNADKVDFSKYTVPVPEEGAESVVLYAKWTLNRYKLTYKYGYIEDDPETTDKDESVIDLHSTEKIYGDSIEEPTLDDREGYIFAGWDKEVPATMPAKDLTFIAQWTPIEYTITYKDGNAQLSGLSPVSYTIETESFSLPSLDDKTGYTFAGWTGSNGNTAQKDVTIVKGSTGNKTYTANWTPIDYTITFEENGGSAVQDITKGYELAVQAPIAPTKTGYTFGGWYENKECTGDTYAFNTMPLNGKTLYAKWNVVTYQIEYTMDGGVLPEGAVTSYTIESDEITLPTPTREGYTFGGWKDSEGVAAEKIAAGSTGNKEFTATWDAIEYGITYDLADGSLAGTNPATYTVEDGITLINPTKEGYDFAGWTGTDLDGAVMNVTIENGSIGARSYTATWTPTEYEITYVLGDGALA
ncbi:MAG: InlB B-repeat-containing protein, partial [Firmicutes bacterium]|nr:InlB B-repeat-containing protein [Bacillota bacterium]